MKRRHLIGPLIGAVCLALLGTAGTTAAQPRTQVEFWHGLANPLGGLLEQIVADFNASQSQYEVKPTFKGSYPETMVAAIAAFRAGNAPHIVQMFEVGTATMMSARGAIKPVHELLRETGVALDPNAYLPAVRGYYSLPDGRLMSMPFNSSTAIMFYNKDAFKKAGLDPNKPSADLAGADRGREEDPVEQCRPLRLHDGVADLDTVRAVQRDPRRAAGDQGQRDGGHGRRAAHQ